VHKRLPHLIYSPQHKRFKVSSTWTKMFIKSHLNWSYTAPTTIASKLPLDWESKSKTMALKVTFLVKLHNIPKSLMVNYNQTRVCPIPIGGSRTLEKKSAKHVHVVRIKDKRQVTTLVFFATSQLMFLLQIIFTNKMERCLPPHNHGKSLCYFARWHLTYLDNHWSSLQISTGFVINILEPYQ
jgi:hypothetical protein